MTGARTSLSTCINFFGLTGFLGWKPTTDLRTAVRKTIEYYLEELARGGDAAARA